MSDQILKWRRSVYKVDFSFLHRYIETAHEALGKVEVDPDKYEEFQTYSSGDDYVRNVVNHHKNYQNYAGVLLAYATFEEHMTHSLKTFGGYFKCNLKPNDLRDRGVEKFKKYIHNACSIDQDDLSIDWRALSDMAVVRNAIIHANGDKNLVRNKQELEQTVQRYHPDLSLDSGVKLRVDKTFVSFCIDKSLETCLAINEHARKSL